MTALLADRLRTNDPAPARPDAPPPDPYLRGRKAVPDHPIMADSRHDQALKEAGYVVTPLLGADQVAELKEIFLGFHAKKIGGFHATMYHPGEANRILAYESVRRVIEPLLNKLLLNYRVCIGNFMVKEPQDEESLMPMHQDWSFVDEPEQMAVHVWIPLVDVTPENGCLAVIPGTHLFSDAIRPHADDIPYRELMPLLQAHYAKELSMKAGEAIIYDGRLIHGSRPNRTGERRLSTSAITVPVGQRVLHAVRVDPGHIEVFEVGDDFFWTYQLFQRPQGVRSLGVIDYVVKQLTVDDLAGSAWFPGIKELAGQLAAT